MIKIVLLLLIIIIIITVVVIIINNITKITVWKMSKLSPRREFTFADIIIKSLNYKATQYVRVHVLGFWFRVIQFVLL